MCVKLFYRKQKMFLNYYIKGTWTVYQALFFTITLITTIGNFDFILITFIQFKCSIELFETFKHIEHYLILNSGYGDITVDTKIERCIVAIYALLGIPIYNQFSKHFRSYCEKKVNIEKQVKIRILILIFSMFLFFVTVT